MMMIKIFFLLFFYSSFHVIYSFKVYKSHTDYYGTNGWCISVFDPHWPFSYEKSISSGDLIIESKGRTASNLQSIGM